MKQNISKTLEGLIARTAFKTTKAEVRSAVGDYLVLELLGETGSMAYQLLSARLQDWELYQLRLRLETALHEQGSKKGDSDPEAYFQQFCNQLTAKYVEANRISTSHALIELLEAPDSVAAPLFARYHITAEVLRQALVQVEQDALRRSDVEVRMLDLQLHTDPTLHPTKLDRFGTDLTAEARAGRLDPVIGRGREIERMVEILCRRKKNNPILLGDAGVGKTAIVEGLAQRLATGEVPHKLQGKRLFSLDVASLVAGTKFRGEFEERIRELMEELKRDGQTILFIDELHTIVGAGATQGSLDVANILKPTLARGELQLIGATTVEEYRRDIGQDAALERRFQRISIEPPTPTETLQILRQTAPHYEAHHRVRYTDEALQACVTLTERYITDRTLPDKAIDLMDEAGARAHLQSTHTKQALQATEQARAVALATARYAEAAELRTETLHLQHALTSEEMVTIDRSFIEQVMTTTTGIPIERLAGEESDRLRGLKSHLQRRIIGQEEAVEQLTRCIVRSRVGLKRADRPIGVFLFVGPTGVGKTLLAKELAHWLFDERRGLIRLDMSEYSEKHNVARLIGSPPGYVGYGEGGQLTEAVRRQPYAVVLLDELEKAHSEVYNVLLQLLDEGWLTDGSGRRVDFRNTIVVMTSNVGSREVAERGASLGFS
ncbi:MAG: ATP-dependent Clp protease ATP-binding subunit, partial [Alistipes sp.]|nr:ATP-dependent Clp protease ATP-binding subunit [Alistipes sp.]